MYLGSFCPPEEMYDVIEAFIAKGPAAFKEFALTKLMRAIANGERRDNPPTHATLLLLLLECVCILFVGVKSRAPKECSVQTDTHQCTLEVALCYLIYAESVHYMLTSTHLQAPGRVLRSKWNSRL